MGWRQTAISFLGNTSKLATNLLTRLDKLIDSQQDHLIRGGLKGIEKESLRISGNGMIAQTPHPAALGAALTHPHITTDYSEALLEFITPPFAESRETLRFMEDIHRFVYANLTDELLLAASMPCGIDGDESIPIAEYGSSNIGKMKHVYRHGLWHRYGRAMQSIAGIHFNYSVPARLWPVLQRMERSRLPIQEFIDDAYFGLIRNFFRQGWIILYLFGASPAICRNFFKGREQLFAGFDDFDAHTLYHPYATSLRMSDIGYKSVKQASLKIDYNSLSGYVASLSRAIETPYPEYQKIGVKVNGEYRQLSSNILQIENEFYSTIRPKQIAKSGEKPTLALKRRGVHYVEIRLLDLDLFAAVGMQEQTALFLEAFLLTCLLQESPPSDDREWSVNNDNQLAVAHQGRKPGLQLQRGEQSISLQDWALEILDLMQPVCELLDQDSDDRPYGRALQRQRSLVKDPELTPSARILAGMRQTGMPFAPFAMKVSEQHQQWFQGRRLEDDVAALYRRLAEQSHARQREVEARDDLGFDEFLERYFAQK